MSSIVEAGAGRSARRVLSSALLSIVLAAGFSAAPESAEPAPVELLAVRLRPAVVARADAMARSATSDGPSSCRRPWVAPVAAPVTDPFRPPDHPYGPGNRGIEYGTEPGQDVVAVADGVVEFAGPVAGRPVVVVANGGGLRSSYVNLRERLVVRGQLVTRGEPIAVADAAFHLGVRRAGHYLDPARLIERLCLVVRLVAS